jgi:hypothetical protein
MLVVSVARQLGSGNSFARLLCCPAQPSGAGERRLGSVKLKMPFGHLLLRPRCAVQNILLRRERSASARRSRRCTCSSRRRRSRPHSGCHGMPTRMRRCRSATLWADSETSAASLLPMWYEDRWGEPYQDHGFAHGMGGGFNHGVGFTHARRLRSRHGRRLPLAAASGVGTARPG